MSDFALSREQACRFLLRHHGLIGEHRFVGKPGALSYVRQCGCVQFDPIDVCGKNAELVFQSRVKGFTKAMLAELLYEDRQLVDYFDKNLAIIPVEDWPYFARERAIHMEHGRSREEVNGSRAAILGLLAERAFISSRDLDQKEKVSWYWSDTSLARATLETLYFRGELCVHHKQGSIKHYAPAERLLPGELLSGPDPNETDEAYRDFKVCRRVGAVGLLRDMGSDAFLGIDGLKSGGRTAAFQSLLTQRKLLRGQVEGIKEPVYARAEDASLLCEIAGGAVYAPRMELLAPLDCLLWDRRLIRMLFDFSYTWEIYTPRDKRQYGYYVLPLLYGEALVGRVEAVRDAKEKTLRVKGVWWEGKPMKKELDKCLKRFAAFNGCEQVVREE